MPPLQCSKLPCYCRDCVKFFMNYFFSNRLIKCLLCIHLKNCFSQNSCFCSVVKSCLTICNPMDWSTPGFPVLYYLPEFAQTQVHWVSDALQPCHPLFPLLPPSAFHSIKVFSKEAALHIRWLKCWSFSFSISPSNEYSRLISFSIGWLDLPAV